MEIIDDVNTMIENLMGKEYGEELPFDISFAVPSRDFSPVSNTKPTINFYLYDIRENTQLRSNEPLIERRSDGSVIKKRPPARIQLFYCVTGWSPAQEDAVGTKTREEHKQLSKALVALIKYPTIPPGVLSGDLIGQQPPLPTTVVLPDGMENPAQFWNALDGLLKPFLDYRVTISLDFHRETEGRMVVTKTSEYGSFTPVYVAAIRPSVHDHPKGAPLSLVSVTNTPAVALDQPANKDDTTIVVSSTGGLSKDDMCMIVDGDETEFTQLGDIPSGGAQIPVTAPLLFDHGRGTELKRLNLPPDEIDLKLAGVASAPTSEIPVTGSHAGKLRAGEVFKLEESGNVEYFQITRVSGPELGVGDSESMVQFGGIVTNSASSPVPVVGAKITLLNAQGIYVAETMSSADGRYLFKKFGIGTGKYTLKVEAQGYNNVERTINNITAAKIDDFIFRLESG